MFNKLSLNVSEDYDIKATYNANQVKYVYDVLYKSTKTAALEEVEKNKFKFLQEFRDKKTIQF